MTIFNKNTPSTNKDHAQVKELIRILNIVITRIDIALHDGDQDVAVLTKDFIGMLSAARQIDTSVKNLENPDEKIALESQCQQLTDRVQSATVAFQFYDRLNQRMAQASKILLQLTEVLNDEKKSLDIKTWQELEDLIRASFTLDADLPLLDDILKGLSIEEALKKATTPADNDDVEFF